MRLIDQWPMRTAPRRVRYMVERIEADGFEPPAVVVTQMADGERNEIVCFDADARRIAAAITKAVGK